jgi:hypothetical protein
MVCVFVVDWVCAAVLLLGAVRFGHVEVYEHESWLAHGAVALGVNL